MWTGRDRDSQAPTQVAAWQDRLSAPLPRDEGRLRCGRAQVGTQLNAQKRVGTLAPHMQRQAAVSRHEGIREALMGLCGGAAASLLKVSFRMSSMKEHQSRTNTFAPRRSLRDDVRRSTQQP